MTGEPATQTGEHQQLKDLVESEGAWNTLHGWIFDRLDQSIGLALSGHKKTLGLYLPLTEGGSNLLSILVVNNAGVPPKIIRVHRDRLWQLLTGVAETLPGADLYKRAANRFRGGVYGETTRDFLRREDVDWTELLLLGLLLPKVPHSIAQEPKSETMEVA